MRFQEVKNFIPADNRRSLKDRIELGRQHKLAGIREENNFAFPQKFCFIECFVGLFEKRLPSFSILGEKGNSSAAGELYLFSSQFERRRANIFLNLLAELPGL